MTQFFQSYFVSTVNIVKIKKKKKKTAEARPVTNLYVEQQAPTSSVDIFAILKTRSEGVEGTFRDLDYVLVDEKVINVISAKLFYDILTL